MSEKEWHERFWSKVAAESADSCWIWTSAVSTMNYGIYTPHKGKVVLAHRFAYADRVGPIPEDLVLDHLCRVTLCVNPAHLEPVTVRENTLRGVGPTAINARKTHCKRGHEFTPANTYRIPSNNGRACRTCRYAIDRRHKERRAAVCSLARVLPDGFAP